MNKSWQFLFNHILTCLFVVFKVTSFLCSKCMYMHSITRFLWLVVDVCISFIF